MCNEVALSENRRPRGSGAVVFRDKVANVMRDIAETMYQG